MSKPCAMREHREWVLGALDQFERRLQQYALRLAGDESMARDAVQHTFLRLCDASRVELQTRLAPWLFAVCRNRVLDDLRRAGKDLSLGGDSEIDLAGREVDPSLLVEQRDLQALVRALIDGLPPASREILDLMLEGLSYAEVAEVTGMKAGSVRVRVHRAIHELRGDPRIRELLETDAYTSS